MKACKQKILHSKKGVSSVLIIFMVIVLVTLGGVAIMSAEVNRKLGSKTEHWAQEFYRLEAESQRVIQQVDAFLAQAETLAQQYLTMGSMAGASAPDIPDEMQRGIQSAWMGQRANAIEIFERVYAYHARRLLSGMQITNAMIIYGQGFETMESTLDMSRPWEQRAITTFAFTAQTGDQPGDTYLEVNLDIVSPRITTSVIDSQRTGGLRVDAGQLRYEIVRWQQKTHPFDYAGEEQIS